MNGLVVLYGVWLGVTSLLNGRPGNLVAVALILIATLATLGLLLRDENDRGASAVGLALGLTFALMGIGSPLPSFVLPWAYVAVMVWGFVATFVPAVPGELLWSRSGPALPRSPALSPTHQAQMKKVERSERRKAMFGER